MPEGWTGGYLTRPGDVFLLHDQSFVREFADANTSSSKPGFARKTLIRRLETLSKPLVH